MARKFFLAAACMLLLVCPAAAGPGPIHYYLDGKELSDLCFNFQHYQQMTATGQKAGASEVIDLNFRVGVLNGYVEGIADADAESLDVPNEVTREQLAVVVSKYVLSHPEKWHLPARKLVIDALAGAFGRAHAPGSKPKAK